VSGAGDVDRVAFLLETTLEEAGHLDLVFHHEHPHAHLPGGKPSRER
jgi:hypothetical protein